MVTILLLSAAVSVDAVGVGLSFGVRRIKMGFIAMLVMSLTGLCILIPSVLAGAYIQLIVGENVGKYISGAILMFMGMWIVIQTGKKADTSGSRTVKIVREPEVGDIDGSGSIDCVEAVFIGVAMSVDSVGICMGTGGITEDGIIFPFAAMAMQLFFILIGIKMGKTVGKHFNTDICTFVSGMVVMLMGVLNIIG
jgi:putative sporulation protein YtaF